MSVLIALSMKESYIFRVDQRKNDTFFECIAAIFAEVSVYLLELKFVRKKSVLVKMSTEKRDL